MRVCELLKRVLLNETTMSFPALGEFPQRSPTSAYAAQMGASIANLLRVFHEKVPDAETNAHVLELAVTPDRWSAGHALFDVVRGRYLKAGKAARSAQYCFEESCLQAMYNESDPQDPFDSVSAYWVVPNAIALARAIGIPVETVLAAMVPSGW
jgi:hypothetical protein